MLLTTALSAFSLLGFQPTEETKLIRDFNKNFINNTLSEFYEQLDAQKQTRVEELLHGMKSSPKPSPEMTEKINSYWHQIKLVKEKFD